MVRIALGAEAVAAFNTIRTVCRSVNQTFGIINATIFPDLQFEYGRGNLPLVRKLFHMAVNISIFIGFVGAAVLCIVGMDLYNWWTQNRLSISLDVWSIFMIGVFLNAVWWTSVVTYRMTNRPMHFAIASTAMSVVSVVCCYIMSGWWGMIGAAVSTTLFEAVMALYILPDSFRLLGMKVSDLYRHLDGDVREIKRKILCLKHRL